MLNRNHRLEPRYILNLGKYKLPEKQRLQYLKNEEYNKVSNQFLRPVPLATNGFLFIQFGKWCACDAPSLGLSDERGDLIGLGFFDKKNQHFFIAREDNENYPCFYPNFSDGENSVISFVNAMDAIDFLKKHESVKIYQPFVNVAGRLKPDDNPVMIVAKLKN